jgi:hypothetical protein
MKPNPGFSEFDKTMFEVDDLELDGAIFHAMEKFGPHPEERALARVSKDGNEGASVHPSRRGQNGRSSR